MGATDFWERYSRPSIFYRIVIIICVFLQFYPTKLVFLPVTLRVILSILGIGLVTFQYIYIIITGKKIYVDKAFLSLVIPLVFFTLFSAFSLNYNGTSDSMYLYYFVTSFLMLGSGYFTIRLMYWVYGDFLSFEIIVYYCLLAVMVQLVFGIISFVDEPLVLPILLKTEEGLLQLNSTESGRFIGLGQYFMNLGVANGYILLLISPLLKYPRNYGLSRKMKFWIGLCYIFIAILGNMQARTTTICFGISLMYLCFSSLQLNIKNLKAGIGQILSSTFLIILLISFIVYYFGDELYKYQNALNYGFELFDSISDGKGAKTRSSDMLSWMLTIWPTTTKTWLIGDGLYFTPGGGYYMRTDVGYARLIFYFGVFGMIVYYIYQIIVSYFSFKNITKEWKSIWIYMLIMLFVINVKSCVDFVFYYSLFYSFNLLQTKSKEESQTIILTTNQLSNVSA